MANPVLGENAFRQSLDIDNNHVMTTNGTILKTCFLAILMSATFAYTWYLIGMNFADKAVMLSKFGLFGGIALVLFICFMPKNKSLIITTPLYAMCEGLILGYISALANKYYPGIVPQAAMGTIISLFTMFILYKSGLVKASEKFKMVIFNCTFVIFLIYLLEIILNIFHIGIPVIFSNSPIGLAVSAIIIAIASFNLIVDFDLIESFSGKVAKEYEWYCGFSLLVTIVWIYIEILNLLMKLQSRSK